MQPAVLLRIEEGIARIVFDRPDQGNKIGDDFVSAFDDATLKCSERDDIRALVISATGKRFSVGGDISAMVARRDELPTKIRHWNALLQGSLARLQRMRAPSVVAVQGVAAGGSVSLVAGCDVIVAAESARFVEGLSRHRLLHGYGRIDRADPPSRLGAGATLLSPARATRGKGRGTRGSSRFRGFCGRSHGHSGNDRASLGGRSDGGLWGDPAAAADLCGNTL